MTIKQLLAKLFWRCAEKHENGERYWVTDQNGDRTITVYWTLNENGFDGFATVGQNDQLLAEAFTPGDFSGVYAAFVGDKLNLKKC